MLTNGIGIFKSHSVNSQLWYGLHAFCAWVKVILRAYLVISDAPMLEDFDLSYISSDPLYLLSCSFLPDCDCERSRGGVT